MQEIELLQAMMDDEFQKILQEDVILNELEKEKFNTKNAFWEVRSILSPVFEIDGYKVSAITPAIWSVLYTLDNAYTNESEITDFDTDLFFYLLATGLKNIDDNFLVTAKGYVQRLGLNYESVKMDLLYLYKLAFQPLEMMPVERRITDAENTGFGADWLTMVIQIACNATNKTSDDVLYNMSLTECNYYLINEIRKTDKEGNIKKRNSEEINKLIYERTFELGRQYYKQNYGDVKNGNNN